MESEQKQVQTLTAKDVQKALISLTVLIVSIAAIILMSRYSSKKSTKKYPQAVAAMQEMIDGGIVHKVQTSGHRVYISPLAWQMANVEEKEVMAFVAAQYCADRNKNDSIRVTVYDYQSGRELASFSELWGFTLAN